MPGDASSLIRNVGIVAHINAGKTTLSEAILFATRAQRSLGSVECGTAAMDFMSEEQRRGISIGAAVARVCGRGHVIHLFDTPGHVDFGVEVERCLQVLDGLVVVLDGVRGVESQTRGVWAAAERWHLPRLVFVNKLDRPTADFEHSVLQLEDVFDVRAVPMVQPQRDDEGIVSLLDAVTGKAHQVRAGSTSGDSAAALLRNALVEFCAGEDESVLTRYSTNANVEDSMLHAVVRRLTLSRSVVPVFGGAALEMAGVAQLLDGICRYLPTPRDRIAQILRSASASGLTQARLAAQVFKVFDDRGEAVHLVRIFTGRMFRGQDLVGSDGLNDQALRVTALWRVVAGVRESIEAADLGEVVAVTLDRPVATGQVLHEASHPVQLPVAAYPPPLVTAQVEAEASDDSAGLQEVVNRLALEDPSIQISVHPQTCALMVSGMGELHLEVFAARVLEATGRPLRLHRPEVARQITLAGSASARVHVQLSHPGPTSSTPGLIVSAEPAAIDRPAIVLAPDGGDALLEVAAELERRLRNGGILGAPVVGVEINLVGEAVDGGGTALEVALLEAALAGLRRIIGEVGTRELEPEAELHLECPADVLTYVLADLRAKGCTIDAIDSAGPLARVSGRVRLRNLLGYANRLRSLSRGLGSFQLNPVGFIPEEGERPG